MAFFDHFVLAFLISVYCSLLCMNGECKITPGERKKIINLHNTFRASVTPSASDMEKMVKLHCIVKLKGYSISKALLVATSYRRVIDFKQWLTISYTKLCIKHLQRANPPLCNMLLSVTVLVMLAVDIFCRCGMRNLLC